jgi:hypothetical protein
MRSSGLATALVSGASEASDRGAGQPASEAGACDGEGGMPGGEMAGAVAVAGADAWDGGATADVEPEPEQDASARPSSSAAGLADLS